MTVDIDFHAYSIGPDVISVTALAADVISQEFLAERIRRTSLVRDNTRRPTKCKTLIAGKTISVSHIESHT